ETGCFITREPIRLPEHVDPSLMQVHDAAAGGADPQAAVAIAQDPAGLECARLGWHRNRRDPRPPRPSSDAAARRDDQRAIVGVGKTLNTVRFARQGMELREIRFPTPEAVPCSHPQIALAVLVQPGHARTETAVRAIALDACVPNRTEFCGGLRAGAD